MKTLKLLTLVLLIVTGTNLRAQTEKGKLWIAGSSQLELKQGGHKTNYDGDVDESSKYSYFDLNLTPKIGYTVIDNMPLGLFIYTDFYGKKFKESEDKNRTTEFAIGPFIRYYFADMLGLKPYAEALFGFGFSNDKTKYSNEDDWNKYKEGYFTFRFGCGATYFFNDFIGADLFLGFNHENWSYKSEEPDRSVADKTNYSYNEFLMQMGLVVMIKCRR